LVFVLVEGNINYEIADHCVTLKKFGILHQVESLRSMNYKNQFSTTTEETLKQLPRSPSEEIFDRVKTKKSKKNFLDDVCFCIL
jgi:hypothetical protein